MLLNISILSFTMKVSDEVTVCGGTGKWWLLKSFSPAPWIRTTQVRIEPSTINL